jgi:hypothetical protein
VNYNVDRLVPSAVKQNYEYMIDNGLEFSCIGTLTVGALDVTLDQPKEKRNCRRGSVENAT